MNSQKIAYEMARRKVQFHPNEKWNEIKLWGLFSYTSIKNALKTGYLINHLNYVPENKTYWVIFFFIYFYKLFFFISLH